MKVQSHLENSKYHINQTQTQQVKQYLALGSKLASQVHPVAHTHPGQALGTVPVMRNGHMPPVSDSSTPGSPVTLLTLANNHDSEVCKPYDLLSLYVCVCSHQYSDLITFTMKGWVSFSDKRCFILIVIFLK